MIVRVRQHRRVVIPADAARILGLEVGDRLGMEIIDGRIILTPEARMVQDLRQGFVAAHESLADKLTIARQTQD